MNLTFPKWHWQCINVIWYWYLFVIFVISTLITFTEATENECINDRHWWHSQRLLRTSALVTGTDHIHRGYWERVHWRQALMTFTEATENECIDWRQALMTFTEATENECINDRHWWHSQRLLRTSALMTGIVKAHIPLIFRPKLTIPAAWFLCESWATCFYCLQQISELLSVIFPSVLHCTPGSVYYCTTTYCYGNNVHISILLYSRQLTMWGLIFATKIAGVI